MRKDRVTKEMKISEVAQKYPETASVFIDYGLHCIGCSLAPDETIEQAAQIHQLELAKFLKDLNNAANKK